MIDDPLVIDEKSINIIFDQFQSRAKKRVDSGGTYTTENDPPPGPFQTVISNLLRPVRTAPNIMPYVEGKPIVEIEDLKEEIRKRINDLEKVYSEIIYVKDKNGFLWTAVTKAQTEVTGKESRNEYEKNKERIDSNRLITVTHGPSKDSSDQAIAAWFIQAVKNASTSSDRLELYSGRQSLVAIDVLQPEELPVIYISKIMVPAQETTRSDGTVDKFTSIIVSDTDKFVYTDKQNRPFQIERYYNTPRINPLSERALDIEHTVSLSAEGQIRLLKYLHEVVKKAQSALNDPKTKIEKPVIQQMIVDLNRTIAYIQDTLDITLLAGRTFSDILPNTLNTSVKRIKQIIRNLPNKDTYKGIYMWQKSKTTSDLELVEIKNEFYLEAVKQEWDVFLPGLSSANRGFLSGVERTALSDVEDFFITKASPAPINIVIMSSLAKIFKDKRFLKQVQKYSNRKTTSKPFFVPIFKVQNTKLSKNIPIKPIKPSKSKEYSKRVIRPTGGAGAPPSNQESTSSSLLLNAINSNIYEAVIAQMHNPALINRTGRFAHSVKATEIIKSRGTIGVKYQYLERPYGVFSQKTGKAPWNSVWERRPEVIIDAALRSMGYNKLLDSIESIQ